VGKDVNGVAGDEHEGLDHGDFSVCWEDTFVAFFHQLCLNNRRPSLNPLDKVNIRLISFRFHIQTRFGGIKGRLRGRDHPQTVLRVLLDDVPAEPEPLDRGKSASCVVIRDDPDPINLLNADFVEVRVERKPVDSSDLDVAFDSHAAAGVLGCDPDCLVRWLQGGHCIHEGRVRAFRARVVGHLLEFDDVGVGRLPGVAAVVCCEVLADDPFFGGEGDRQQHVDV